MPANIYGPHGPGINEVTERPVQTSSGSGIDSWFAPCTGNDPNTGTKISYRWLNFVTANLRRAIRGRSVVENELDDDMLLKAIQSADRSLTNIGHASGQALYAGLDPGGAHQIRKLLAGEQIAISELVDGSVQIDFDPPVGGEPGGFGIYRSEFTANGLWTKPENLAANSMTLIYLIGGGGGGGTSGSGDAGGGGEGFVAWVPTATLPATVNVQIGAGGAGNVVYAGAGGNTIFGAYSAQGGQGATGGDGGNGGGLDGGTGGVYTAGTTGRNSRYGGGGGGDGTSGGKSVFGGGGGGGSYSGSVGGTSVFAGAGGSFGQPGAAPGGGGGSTQPGAAGAAYITVFG